MDYKVTIVSFPGDTEVKTINDVEKVLSIMNDFLKKHPGAYMYRPYIETGIVGLQFRDSKNNTIHGCIVEEKD